MSKNNFIRVRRVGINKILFEVSSPTENKLPFGMQASTCFGANIYFHNNKMSGISLTGSMFFPKIMFEKGPRILTGVGIRLNPLDQESSSFRFFHLSICSFEDLILTFEDKKFIEAVFLSATLISRKGRIHNCGKLVISSVGIRSENNLTGDPLVILF